MTATTELMEPLLVASLAAWRVPGTVGRVEDGAVVLTTARQTIRVTRAPPGVPFRWMVAVGDRSRGVGSIAGVLRGVRAALDPDYQPSRLRIAPQPLVPP